jgi:GntR family transcriptional regulator/MocR family aminotransferase
MELRIERSEARGARSAVPVYRQIAGQIRERVESGALAPGDRLPPIRELAHELGVNRDTVALAYEELAAEGVVESRVGRGTFVRGLHPRGPGSSGPIEPQFSRAAERLLDYEHSRPQFAVPSDTIPLHSLVPDPSMFPVEAFRRAVNRAFADIGASLLAYGGPQGFAGLREVLAERLRSFGLIVGPDSLVLSSGASQGISLAMRLFAGSGDTVAIEAPTYHNALATMIGLDLKAAPVPMRGTGPDLDLLDRQLSRPEVKAFYTIPTFHNPMGISTSVAHRRDLLAIAARHGKPVIEDAYEMDLRFAGHPIPPLAALDETGLVVQLTSFSKSLFPGVRAGALVARGRAVDALLALKHATDLGGTLSLQAALADFVRSGAYDRHLVALRKRLRSRRDAMIETLTGEMPEGVSWTTPEGGYQIWLELPEPLDSLDLQAEAMRAGVLFAPGYQFYHDGRPSRGLRLTIALADERSIRRGVATLARLVRERLAAGTASARVASVHM